MLVQYQLS